MAGYSVVTARCTLRRISTVTQKSCWVFRFVAEKMQSLSFLSYNWNTGDQMHSIRACLVYYFIKRNLLKYLFKLTFIGFCEKKQFIIPLCYPNCTRVQRFSFSFHFVPMIFLYGTFAWEAEEQANTKAQSQFLVKNCSYAVVSDMPSIQTRPRGFCLRNGDEVGYHIIV